MAAGLVGLCRAGGALLASKNGAISAGMGTAQRGVAMAAHGQKDAASRQSAHSLPPHPAQPPTGCLSQRPSLPEWRGCVPERARQQDLLEKGVLRFDGHSMRFASNLAASYAAEQLRAKLPKGVADAHKGLRRPG